MGTRSSSNVYSNSLSLHTTKPPSFEDVSTKEYHDPFPDPRLVFHINDSRLMTWQRSERYLSISFLCQTTCVLLDHYKCPFRHAAFCGIPKTCCGLRSVGLYKRSRWQDVIAGNQTGFARALPCYLNRRSA